MDNMELEVITPADETFVKEIYAGASPWKAAVTAFPMMEDPVAYALSLLDTSIYIKQRLRGYFEGHGLSDENIVEKFAAILDKAMGVKNEEHDDIQPRTALSILKEVCKLKDLYPDQSANNPFKSQENFDPTTQAGLLKEYMKNALEMMPAEELAKKVRSPIANIPILEDKDVFDG